jgi:hypothetical protein
MAFSQIRRAGFGTCSAGVIPDPLRKKLESMAEGLLGLLC